MRKRVGQWIASGLYHLSHLHRRMLVVYFAIIGPRAAYQITRWLARKLYFLFDPIRLRSEAQCQAALAKRIPASDIPRVAETAFVHRALDFTDLYLADRLLHQGTYQRYGGAIPQPHLDRLLAAQKRKQPAILLTAYYGPFDLLPLLLGFNGVHCGAIYLSHDNPDYDAYRRRIRGRSGTELILAEHAIRRLPEILETGGTIAIVADHHAERRGIPATFLGLPTQAMRTVGILACRYNTDVVVAGIRRRAEPFQFEVLIEEVIYPADVRDAADPVAEITHRYLRGLETMILRDPTQYLWAQPRWPGTAGEGCAMQR
ncbi:MAG: lysophospholipid acyltransferase family protein [Phycisphaerae bacterium]|nr:lysophospholipid acyltransferase family protein [Phycisphaerae bacterium]